jgi:hypothetical protein
MVANLGQLVPHGRLIGAFCVGLGCWIVFLHRLRQAAMSRQWAMRALCTALGALATSMSIQVVAVQIDAATGVPNLGRMASNCATVLAAGATQVFVLYVTRGHAVAHRRARWLYANTAIVLALIMVAFAATPLDPASSIEDPRHDTTVYSSPYVYLFLAYLLATFTATAASVGRYINRTAGVMRVSLALVVGGSVLGVGYVICKLAFLLGHDLHHPVPASEATTARPLYILTSAVWLAAIVVPAADSGRRAVSAWGARYRAYQRLYPLWRSLYEANPAIALTPRLSWLANATTILDLPFLLYRRIIEIRDAQLALRLFAPAVRDDIAKADDPAVEAAHIRLALRAQAAGERQPQGSHEVLQTKPGNLDAEVAWLEQVAIAFRADGVRLRRNSFKSRPPRSRFH